MCARKRTASTSAVRPPHERNQSVPCTLACFRGACRAVLARLPEFLGNEACNPLIFPNPTLNGSGLRDDCWTVGDIGRREEN